MNEETYRAQVDARAVEIMNAVVERGGNGLWEAHALLALDAHTDRIIDIIRRALAGRTSAPDGRPTGGPFHTLPCMLLLCRWEDRLPDEGIEIIREFMTRGVLERGNTENHWLMYYVGNLLASERWPEMETTWNGLPPEAMRAEATRWILGMIDRTARLGHHEYDSPQYHIEHMISMIALADHVADPHLRGQAEQTLALFVADMALEYFHGAWAGGHSREGYRQNTWTRTGPIAILQYLYFGGEPFDPATHIHGFGVPAAAARYRPPAVFAAMLAERTFPHVVKKTKAPRTLYRNVESDPGSVRKYTYMSRSFALGSTQLNLSGPEAGPIDLVSWDLTWNGPRHEAKIVCNHPYRHPGRFSAFLAGFPQHIRRQISTGKPYLQWPDRLFGASPYERMMQHEGTIIALYRIPEDDEAPFVNLYLPKSIAWVERNGWIMGDAGGFHVGIYPIGRFAWEDIQESDNASIMVLHGDLINGWLLHLSDLHSGLVLEAVESEAVGSFDAFVEKRAGRPPDLSRWEIEAGVGVETLEGSHLEMIWDGAHRVDGCPIDYDAYPLYEAPGVEAPSGEGRMRFRSGEHETRLDFGVDPSKPLIPMRVIG
jgi:hypothetical protein